MSENIRKFLDISTAHLMEKTRQDLGDEVFSITVHPTQFGWVIPVPIDEVLDLAQLPSDLMDCINLAKARDCDFILFDVDAATDSDLVEYDDDHTQLVRVHVSQTVEYQFDMPVTANELKLHQHKPHALEERAEEFFTTFGPKPAWMTAVQGRSIDVTDCD